MEVGSSSTRTSSNFVIATSISMAFVTVINYIMFTYFAIKGNLATVV